MASLPFDLEWVHLSLRMAQSKTKPLALEDAEDFLHSQDRKGGIPKPNNW
jgi:hypothetical protein